MSLNSALASKKWSNHNDKDTVSYVLTCFFLLRMVLGVSSLKHEWKVTLLNLVWLFSLITAQLINLKCCASFSLSMLWTNRKTYSIIESKYPKANRYHLFDKICPGVNGMPLHLLVILFII